MWRYAPKNPCSYCWHDANAKRSLCVGAAAAGAVRVRPIGLRASEVVKRYQYQRSGASPGTSTCTAWAHSASALVTPEKIMDFIASSAASSQRTGTATGSRSPTSRVQRTTLPGEGLHEAAPSENGYDE